MTRADRWLDEHASELASAMTDRQYERMPELAARWGPAGRRKCETDARYHLEHLSSAVAHDAASLFVEYVGWAKSLLEGFGIGGEELETNLRVMRELLVERAPEELADALTAPIDAALDGFDEIVPPPSAIDPKAPHAGLARRYLEALLEADRARAMEMILGAADDGVPVRELYLHVFAPAQREIGRLWQSNQVSVATEHYCTAATQLVIAQLYPRMFAAERKGRRMLATCIEGELHELGLRMVADFFEMDGWDTHYLGASVPTRSVAATVAERGVDLVTISATMAKQVSAVAALIEAIRADPRTAEVPILVGGPPFASREDLWRRVGADGSASDAQEAVQLGNRLVGDGT